MPDPRTSPNHETSPLLYPSAAPGLQLPNEFTASSSTTMDTDDASTGLRLRIAAAMFSFFHLGLLLSSLGAMLPPLSSHYHLTDIQVSLIFIFGPVGYIAAAHFNSTVHHSFGQRGIAIISPLFSVLATGVLALHPPYWLVLGPYAVQGVGAGLLDGSWCAWAGSMKSANMVSGLLHGSFSSGAMVGPASAGALLAKGVEWWVWYRILFLVSILELIILTLAFRDQGAARYRQEKLSAQLDTSNWKAIFNYRATWACAAYFLAYVGTETAISGWIIFFMTRSRRASLNLAGLASSAYWGGQALGRLSLGPFTDRYGVRRSTSIYFLLCIILEVLFILIPTPVAAIATMAMLGFFSGPLFPSGVVVLTKLLPDELHVPAVSFVASLGQVGAAVLPFGIGAVIQGAGIGVFQFALPVFSLCSLGLWVVFSRLRGTVEDGVERERRED